MPCVFPLVWCGKNRWLVHGLTLIGLTVLCWFLFFFRLGERDLWNSHEGRAGQDAQSILDTGCWGLPHLFDGRLELQKPPLYYWLVAASAQMRGGRVDALDVRLPSALSAWACVLLIYLFGLGQGRPLAGFLATLVLATFQHFTWMARIGRIDMPLTLVLTASLLSFYQGNQSRLGLTKGKPWIWFFLAYVAVALAIMLKGPIGAILPLAAVLSFLLVEKETPTPWRIRKWLELLHTLGLWWGLPLILILTGPWFIWANQQTQGELYRSFFLYHNVARALGGAEEGLHARPWWFYGPRLVADLLPWTPVFIAGSYFGIRRLWREDSLLRFGLAWAGVIIILLSLARFKRSDYLLPAYPGLALYLGVTVESWFKSAERPKWMAWGLGLMIGGCVFGWWIYVVHILPAGEPAREYRRFAQEILNKLPAGETLVFFRAEPHALAFHVGRPNHTFVEWENLNEWAGNPGSHYVVMPPDSAKEWPQHLTAGLLQEVLNNQDLAGGYHERPLVLLCTYQK